MNSAQSETMLERALQYATLGWRVFPVTRQKTPLTSNGFKDASTDTRAIKSWWKANPNAGIGVATGAVSGIVVLDLDAHKEGAVTSLQEIVKQHGAFPQEVVSQTGGGGSHFFFVHPGDGTKVSNAQALFGFPGIDVRGDGGYVVLPPSPHMSNNFYTWTDGKSPFEASPGICPAFLYEERARNGGTEKFQFTGDILEGARNATLTSIAGLLRAMGLEKVSIRRTLVEQNEARCHPPLPDAELDIIVTNIIKYPPRVNRGTGIPENTGLAALLAYEHNDTGFAKMIAHVFLGKLRYNHTTGKWLIWNNHYWQVDTDCSIILKASDTAEVYRQAVDLITDDDRREQALRYSVRLQNKVRLDAAIALTASRESVKSLQKDWDVNAHLIAAENGVIDLKTGKMRSGVPEDMISSCLTVAYDPDAKCPAWKKFLSEIFQGDQKVIDFVQVAVGYTLTGETDEQCLFLLIGSGANGKSTFLDAIRSLVGAYGFTAPFSTFERTRGVSVQTNDLASMSGKRFVVASETNPGTALDEAKVKSLTGGDVIAARFLYQELFEFKPIGKIWLAVNHKPRVMDDSVAFWRRIRKINFPAHFYSPGDDIKNNSLPKDPRIPKILKAEAVGILTWAVKGAKKWYDKGLETPETIIEATKEYRKSSDPLDAFISECCVANDPDTSATVVELYKAYVAHCKAGLMKHFEILSATRFQGRIERDYTRSTSMGNRTYDGICLNSEGQKLLATSGTPQFSLKPKEKEAPKVVH